MTAMNPRIFLHTLSAPEHVWLTFLREFFSQPVLIQSDGTEVPNRFHYVPDIDPDKRDFDIHLHYSYDQAKSNALPALVIEDTGCVQLGLTINQEKSHSISPQTMIKRADQIRHTYVFHCLSKDRGESRMLAAILSFAITVFRGAILKEPPMVKIEPFSIGASQPLRAKGVEDCVDTPVQVTFTCMEFWNTVELGPTTAGGVRVSFAPEARTRFVRGYMETKDPLVARYIRGFMSLVAPNSGKFVNASMDVDAPADDAVFVHAHAAIEDAISSQRFVRSKMTVKKVS